MINGPLHIFVLGHITQAQPSYVFGAMAIQFFIVFLGYLCANIPSLLAFLLCGVVASTLSIFLFCCIYVLTVSLSDFRFVLQQAKRTHNSTVLNQTMIQTLGISTIVLALGDPLMFVLNMVGTLSTQHYVLISPVFGVITVAIFLAILKATHLEGEAKRMEAIAEELKTDNELQTKFLRFVYHEIRNPFNSIMLGLSHLEEEEALLPYHELLVMLRRSANAMNRVIGDVVELTQARGLQLVLEAVCIQSVLASALECFTDLAAKKHIVIQQKVSKQFPLRLLGDSSKLKKIFEVLISNAVKFSPPGSLVKVDLQAGDPSFGFCTLRFSVQDSGPGIPDTLAPMIFQPFAAVRPGDFSEDEDRGSGLGLCFAKNLADLMSGTLTFSSNQNKGSTFTLNLSLETCQHQELAENYVWNKIVSPQRPQNNDYPHDFLARITRSRNASSGVQSRHLSSVAQSRDVTERSVSSKLTCAPTGRGLSNGSTNIKVVPHNQRSFSLGFNDLCPRITQTDTKEEGNALGDFKTTVPIEPSWRKTRCASVSIDDRIRTYRASSMSCSKERSPVSTSKTVDEEESSLENHKESKSQEAVSQRNGQGEKQGCFKPQYMDDLEIPSARKVDDVEMPSAYKTIEYGAIDGMTAENGGNLQPATLMDQTTSFARPTRQRVLSAFNSSSAQTPFSARARRQRLTTPLVFEPLSGGKTDEKHSLLEANENEEERNAQVLIVDDVKSNRKLACLILEKAGCVCDEACDGLQAVNMAKQHQYQMIIMDNVMPVMDGVEATRQIVAFDKAVAIVALTGNVLQKDQLEFIQAGAKYVIEKPANKDQLLKACNRYVELDCSVKKVNFDLAVTR